jgi:hypothetical protein
LVLREQFQTGGPARLRAVVGERAAEPGIWPLSARRRGRTQDRRQPQCHPTVLTTPGKGAVFSYSRTFESDRRAMRLAVGVPVAVPGGYTLVVGRDIEDQRQFADTMWQVALWSVGLLSALGIGAGLLISRTVLDPHRRGQRGQSQDHGGRPVAPHSARRLRRRT